MNFVKFLSKRLCSGCRHYPTSTFFSKLLVCRTSSRVHFGLQVVLPFRPGRGLQALQAPPPSPRKCQYKHWAHGFSLNPKLDDQDDNMDLGDWVGQCQCTKRTDGGSHTTFPHSFTTDNYLTSAIIMWFFDGALAPLCMASDIVFSNFHDFYTADIHAINENLT